MSSGDCGTRVCAQASRILLLLVDVAFGWQMDRACPVIPGGSPGPSLCQAQIWLVRAEEGPVISIPTNRGIGVPVAVVRVVALIWTVAGVGHGAPAHQTPPRSPLRKCVQLRKAKFHDWEIICAIAQAPRPSSNEPWGTGRGRGWLRMESQVVVNRYSADFQRKLSVFTLQSCSYCFSISPDRFSVLASSLSFRQQGTRRMLHSNGCTHMCACAYVCMRTHY
mmetsp:Transcript_34258/g.56235  ORF Transcript_34258/g.56235 Transcript_34258/m.56235 type:complete len:222 (+) Transcript_34258:127-792(+)